MFNWRIPLDSFAVDERKAEGELIQLVMIRRHAEPVLSREESIHIYVDREQFCISQPASLFIPACSESGGNAEWKMFCF